jgi:hypothetical protein
LQTVDKEKLDATLKKLATAAQKVDTIEIENLIFETVPKTYRV